MTALIEVDNPFELVFAEPPLSTFKKQFVDFIALNARPEDFPGLAKGPPPEKLTGAVIVHKFTLDKAKRQGQLVPCAICDGRPKFLYGALYWFPQDGRVRLIGNCCAEKYDPEGFQRAVNTHNFDEQVLSSTEYLEKNLKRTPEVIAELVKLERISEMLSRYRAELKTMPEMFRKLGNAANRQNGEIRLMIPVKQNAVRKQLQDEGIIERVDEVSTVIHRLEGREMLAKSFDPHHEYNALLVFFTDLLRTSDDEYTGTIVDLLDDTDKVIRLASDFASCIARVFELHASLGRASQFFSPRNLDGLKEYGNHKYTDMSFSVAFSGDTVRLELRHPRLGADFRVGDVLVVPEISMRLLT